MAARTDWQETEAMRDAGRFKCRKSYVDILGRHILYGGDLTRRREEVFARSNGRCEDTIYQPLAWRCTRAIYLETFHLHHVIKRSKGRDDRLLNLLALCPECHLRIHNQ